MLGRQDNCESSSYPTVGYAYPHTGDVFDEDGNFLGKTDDIVQDNPRWVYDGDKKLEVIDGNVILPASSGFSNNVLSPQNNLPTGDFEIGVQRRGDNFAVNIVGVNGTEHQTLVAIAGALRGFDTNQASLNNAAPQQSSHHPSLIENGAHSSSPYNDSLMNKLQRALPSHDQNEQKGRISNQKTLSRRLGEFGLQAVVIASLAFPATTFYKDDPKYFINLAEAPNPAAMLQDPIDGVRNVSDAVSKLASAIGFLVNVGGKK